MKRGSFCSQARPAAAIALRRVPARGDEQREPLEALAVGDLHAGDFGDRRIARDRFLQFARLHPLPGDLHQFVGAALVQEKAFGVA